MTQRDWDSARASALTVFLNGNAISEPGARGERISDDSFLLMFNASPKALEFVVPVDHGRQWQVVVDTARADGVPPDMRREGAGRGPADPDGPEPHGAPAARVAAPAVSPGNAAASSGQGHSSGRRAAHLARAMTRTAAGRVRRVHDT